MKIKNTLDLALALLILSLLVSCAPVARPGIRVAVFEKPRIDLGVEDVYMYNPDRDAVNQRKFIMFCNDTVERKFEAFLSKLTTALQKAFVQTRGVYRIKDCEEGDTSQPKLTVKIKEYNFVDDVPRYGQNRRTVSAAVEFKLKFPDMEIKAPDTITDKAVNVRKTGLSMLSEMEMANEVAANIAHKFAKQLVPTIKKEFREFFVDGTDVDKAVHLAENNNWDLAIDIWESIIARDNKNAGAYYNLGIAYEHEREFIKAQEAYKNAVRIDYSNKLFSKYRGKFIERQDVRAKLENDREAIDNGTQESIKKLF